MQGTSFEGYVIRERNAQVLREVRAARLERSLRANRGHVTAKDGSFRLTGRGIRLSIFGGVLSKQTTA